MVVILVTLSLPLEQDLQYSTFIVPKNDMGRGKNNSYMKKVEQWVRLDAPKSQKLLA